jgi:hypothetical protein
MPLAADLTSPAKSPHRRKTPGAVTSAVLYADGGRSESKPGEKWPGQDCGILPQAICPPTPLWVVHVHTKGFGDSIWTINATKSQVLMEVGAK